MESLKEAVAKLSEKVKANLGRISSEEATKNAFIMPFIQLMGYDVFNPAEVTPEYVADVGVKRGERVDYAILIDNKPAIVVECKSCNTELCIGNESQLFRYFTASEASFALLTNGIEYKFYTDLDAPNKLDNKPFLDFSILYPDKINYPELIKLTKQNFDAESIRKAADHLKRVTAIRQVIKSELTTPSTEFVKLVFRKISPSGAMFSDKARSSVSPLVKSVIDDVINDLVKANLASAINVTEEKADQISAETSSPATFDGIVTTQEELEGYAIVKAVLHDTIPPEDVTMKDWKSYCAISFKNNSWCPICRLYFNNPQNLRVGFFDCAKEERVQINSVNDIFNYAGRIKCAVLKYKK